MRAAILVAVAACSGGASPELGLDALLQLPNAQYVPGPFPAASGGPPTLSVAFTHQLVLRGRDDEPISAVLDHTARTAIVGLAGVDGAWIVTAGPPDLEAPGLATLHTTIGLTSDLPVGPFTLQVAAGDELGRIGAPLTADAIATEDAPIAGTLVVGLAWQGRADLDIHVVDPNGTDVYVNHPNSHLLPPPGEPEAPDAWKDGGILDHDGNASCERDAEPTEHVIWTMPAPPGAYVVRVEARAMCGDAAASWYVDAFANATVDDPGTLLGAARGLATPDQVTYAPHGKGAGQTALGFTLP